MKDFKDIKTLGDLKKAKYHIFRVNEEMRKNLINKMQRKEPLFTGIIGYDNSVIPQIENAILSGHNMIFLGERGQAKSRIIRNLINFLDPFVPAISGCEINDSPYNPICKSCKEKIAKLGDKVEITWIPREARYGEKLSTPDVSIADLVGEVDPIKVAEGRYLSDELTIHFGLIPRTNRGIFAINELPDLPEKVQVGLFNIMEERDVQIKGYKVQLPLDICIVASANPEDYTSRGRIITPLKDRFESQIRTHYPKNREVEIAIMEQERKSFNNSQLKLNIPQFIKEIIAEITIAARENNDVNQKSGVSVRMSIANLESIISNAEKRAILLNEQEIVPRMSDMHSIIPSTSGKIELEYLGEDKREEDVIKNIINKAIKKVFDQYFNPNQLQKVVESFKGGWVVEVSDLMPSDEYLEGLSKIEGLKEGVGKLGNSKSTALIASAMEFIFEGLHLYNKLNKSEVNGKIVYR